MEYLKNTRLLNPSSSSNYKAKEKRGMSRTLLTMCDIILRMNEMKSENDNKIFYVPQLSTKINLCRTHFDFLSFFLITHTRTHTRSVRIFIFIVVINAFLVVAVLHLLKNDMKSIVIITLQNPLDLSLLKSLPHSCMSCSTLSVEFI